MALRRIAGGLAAAARLVPALAQRKPLGKAQHDIYATIYGLASRRMLFVNKGIAPVDPAMPILPGFEAEAMHAALYFEVLRAGADALGHAPQTLAEAECGRGGGLLLAAAMWPEARLFGSDIQPSAVRDAGALVGPAAPGRAWFAAADGVRLPLAAGWAEMIVSVEGLVSLAREPYLAEARRVLAPGGVLAATCAMQRPFDTARQMLEASGSAQGFALLQCRDMAPAVLEACRLDAPRRARLLRAVPGPLRRAIEDFAAAPGTPTFEAYASGARSYSLVVLRRR